MAYNPFFYQSNFPQGYMPISSYPQQQSNSITWVQGIEGAKAYPVGAGNSVLLMDSDNQFMYIKTADNAGMPTLKTYEYKEVSDGAKSATPTMDEYVTKAELAEALAKIKPKKKKVIEVEEDE